jgi:hypothetical protein
MTAEEAEDCLQCKPPGTFLVRTSAKPGHLAVSFVAANGSVQKTLIATSPRWSIVSSSEIGQYDSLQDLIKVCTTL